MAEKYESLKKELLKGLSEGNVISNAPMALYSSFRCGGSAALLALPANEDEFLFAARLLQRSGARFMLLGNGTNVLFSDKGYGGVVLHTGTGLSFTEYFEGEEGPMIKAGAGAGLSAIAKLAAENGCAGLEFASGIPGSVGGGLFMNAGAYGGDLSSVVKDAKVITKSGEPAVVSSKDMALSYRHSRFMETGEILLSVTFSLKKGDPREINALMSDFQARRLKTQPLQYPSAGSFFKRPKGFFAGKLIEDAGLKGLRVGGAMVSTKHAGFIINIGGASAEDITNLMSVVQETVASCFGVFLEPEVRIIEE